MVPQVCKEVINILGISGAEQFAASINRPNLHYEVHHKAAAADEFEQLHAWICDNYPEPSAQGIVYCLTRCVEVGRPCSTAQHKL
jgi:superfamily II DNA helicase RecQ